jgi:hypothetical protein
MYVTEVTVVGEVKESGFDPDLEAIINTGWSNQKDSKKKTGPDKIASDEFLRVIATVHVAQELRDIKKVLRDLLDLRKAEEEPEQPATAPSSPTKEGPKK